MRILRSLFMGFALMFFVSAAFAAEIMPSFATAPTGWVTDRYAPSSFGNVGSFAGRDNVLGIGISPADGYGSRPPGQNVTFYNTQGRTFGLGSAGPGSLLSASLYIPEEWLNPQLGHRRADMWASMYNGVGSDPHDYGIIGFTNYGGAPRLQVWDANAGGWVTIPYVFAGSGWVDLSFLFTGGSYVYSVNNTVVYVDSTTNGAINYDAVMLQAYNFNGGDPSLPGAIGGEYTARWSNVVEVPEPGTLALFGLGMAGLTAVRRRRR